MRIRPSILILTVCFAATAGAQQIKPSTPQQNFNKFWQVFNDNYAFFDIKHVNWKAVYTHYKPLVNNNTSNDRLFSVMSAMVKPLQDSHVNIIDAAKKRKFNAARPSAFAAQFYNDSLKTAFWKMCDTTLAVNRFAAVKGYGPLFKGRHLFYFTTSASYGYLRFNRCFARIINGEIDEQEFEMRVLDSLMAQCQNLKAMIIDVRANIGGDDKFSYKVAGRFTNKPFTGHYKQERISATLKFTALHKQVITSEGPYHFVRPVILLTNSKTVSAADVFTLIMKQLPQVKIVGENSEGNFSDMLTADLPNGWGITLSNQRYYSPQLICYEGQGVPVNVKVVNTRENLATLQDPVIITAIKILNR